MFCEGNFAEIDGKTANGLVRQSERYEITSVIDSTKAGRDAGEVLDGVRNGIPIVADLAAALALDAPTCFVVGVAPTSGLLSPPERAVILEAIARGLDIVNGLHEFLNDDIEFAAAAAVHDVHILDVRRPRAKTDLHMFSGRIHEVTCPRIAVLGTDGAIGKRTTATILTSALERRRRPRRDGRHRPDVADPGCALRRRARRDPRAVRHRRARGGGRRGVRGRATPT